MKIFIQAIKFLSLYADQVIKSDTVWSGRITVRGVVVVGRSATLTIKPGTTVLFEKIDSNDDGIGDSEIRVLGRLLAKGTQADPILFQSAYTFLHIRPGKRC
jgi:plastocyanin